MSTAENGPKNGSEVLLDQLNAQGVDRVFASPIAVMSPIWEALSRRGAEEKPRYLRSSRAPGGWLSCCPAAAAQPR